MREKDSIFQQTHYEGEIDLAIVVATIEGIQHHVGGVAKYTQNLLYFLYENLEEFHRAGVHITLYAMEPALQRVLPSYDKKTYEKTLELLHSTGGEFYKLTNNTFGDKWMGDKKSWMLLSSSAATVALNIAERHQACLVISGCTILAQLPVFIHKQKKAFNADICTVHVTHDYAFSSFYKELDEDVLYMDYLCAQWAVQYKNAKIGYVSEYMKKEFMVKYGIPETSFVRSRSGIKFDDDRFKKMSQVEIESTLMKYNIPLNQKIVFSWGRPSPYKRMDLVVSSVNQFCDDVMPVIITAETHAVLKNFVQANHYRAIIVENAKSFELIRALLQWKLSYAVCFLSESEPGTVVPMEAMYLAGGDNGPILIANNTGVYPEIVVNEENGFIVNNTPESVGECINRICCMSDNERKVYRDKGIRHIKDKFSIDHNFLDLICDALPCFKERNSELEEKYRL